MATKGRRTMILAGAVAAAVMLGLGVVLKPRFIIERSTRALHSKDLDTHEKAIESLVSLSEMAVPRLIRECRRLARHQSHAPGKRSDTKVIAEDFHFRFGFALTVLRIGDPAVVTVIGQLDDDDFRYRDILLGALAYCCDARRQSRLHRVALKPTKDEAKRYYVSEMSVRMKEDTGDLRDLYLTGLQAADEGEDVRLAAAEMLEKLKAKKAAAMAQ